MKSETSLFAVMRTEKALILFALLLTALWSLLSCAEAYKVDALSNLAWLHSLLFDLDIHFGNEYKILRQSMFQSYAAESGYRLNPLGAGSAVLLIPFYLLGFVGTFINNLGSQNPLEYDGFNMMFRQAAGLGGAFYAAATVFLSARIATHFASRRTALWAAMLLTAGTPLLYYSSIGSLYPHTATAFAAAFFLDTLLLEQKNVRHVILAGLAGGLMLTASLQCVFMLLLLPLTWWANRKWNIEAWIVFAASLIVGFMPQILVWQLIYGAALPFGDLLSAQAQTNFNPLRTLFSSNHGLFIWSPLLIFSCIGFGFSYRRMRLYSILLIAVCLLLLLVNSIFIPYDDFSFGARRMTVCLPLFVTGLALFLRRIEIGEVPLLRLSMTLAVFICTAWTLLLLGVFAAHIADNEYISFSDMAHFLRLYLGGDAGHLGDISGKSLPASNGGRAMLLSFLLLLFAVFSLPQLIRKAVFIMLPLGSAVFLCTVTFLPQNMEDKMYPVQRVEWHKWQNLKNKAPVTAEDFRERGTTANRLLMLETSRDALCRAAQMEADKNDALDCVVLDLMLHQPERAEKSIRLFGLEKQRDENVYYYLGVIERMRLRPARAVTWFKTSQSIKPNTAALMMLANSYYELHRFEDAADIYRGILEEHPKNEGARKGLELLSKR